MQTLPTNKRTCAHTDGINTQRLLHAHSDDVYTQDPHAHSDGIYTMMASTHRGCIPIVMASMHRGCIPMMASAHYLVMASTPEATYTYNDIYTQRVHTHMLIVMASIPGATYLHAHSDGIYTRAIYPVMASTPGPHTHLFIVIASTPGPHTHV